MNLVEQLKIKSDQVASSQWEVINEIVLSFKQYLDSGKFERYLKDSIYEEELKSRAKTLRFEFWEHKSGCSNTHFNMAGWYFGVDQDAADPYSYKGVRLKDIQKSVINHCLQYLYEKLNSMGFTFCPTPTKYEIHPTLKILQGEIKIGW